MDAERAADGGAQGARLEYAAILGLLVWRAVAVPIASLWQDPVLWVALAWGVVRCPGSPRSRELCIAAIVAFLLGIYVQGQLPHTLRLLGSLK